MLYLQARCNAGIAGLRLRLRHHRTAWLLAGGFGAGVATAVLPGRKLLWLAGVAARIIGMLRVPLVALVAGSRLQHDHARSRATSNPGDA
jgi:hypothetical protein